MTQTSEKKGTQVIFLDQTGSKSVEAIVSNSITVHQILLNIVTKMNLPTIGSDDQPLITDLEQRDDEQRPHGEILKRNSLAHRQDSFGK